MHIPKLKDRIDSYLETSNFKLLNKLPIITVINGRSFHKLTALLDKPFSESLAQCFYSTLIRLMQEIDGAVFGYAFNDEIIIISRNDQSINTEPWFDNYIQKLASITSSIATLQFNNHASSLDLNLMGEPTFYSQVFTVPNITEAINVLVSKQQQAFQTSVYFACLYELLKKYDKVDISDLLSGTTVDDKINLLYQECQINFNEYPSSFRRGAASFKAPSMVSFEGKEILKNKLSLNTNIPIFTRDHAFLNQIFKSGSDILRIENN